MDNKKITEVFDRVAPFFSQKINGPVYLVKISGPRWSYVAGYVPDELPFVAPEKVMLFDEWAVLYYPQAMPKVDPEEVRRIFMDVIEDQP